MMSDDELCQPGVGLARDEPVAGFEQRPGEQELESVAVPLSRHTGFFR